MDACIVAAHMPFSRHLVFDVQGGNPEHYLNAGLDWLHASFTSSAFWEHLPPGTIAGLSPLPQGWQRFGIAITTANDELDPQTLFAISAAPLKVCVYQEWNPVQAPSAWQAMLIAQDAIRPQMLSVPPGFLVSLMALAKLAAHQTGMGSNSMARWRENIAVAQRVLSPVITTMMQAWLAGPSKAAARYRAQAGIRRSHEVPPKLTFFGPSEWGGLRKAERPEPFLMRLFHEKSTALWRDAELWAQARVHWSDDELAAMLGVSRWDTIVEGEGVIRLPELRHLRDTHPGEPERQSPAQQPQSVQTAASAPRQRGRAVPQISRALDMQVQPGLWELDASAEASARQVTPGGQQELELWLLLARQRAAHEARRGFRTQGRGIVALSVDPQSTFTKGQVHAEYVASADVIAQASGRPHAGDRSIVEFLQTYDPEQQFLVVLVKADCDPRRLIATYSFTTVEQPGQDNNQG
jgi:hypothetical protein